VLPLYEAWANFLPAELDEHVANLKSNKAFWKGKSEQGQPIEKVDIPKFNVSVLRLRGGNRVSATNGSGSQPNTQTQIRKESGTLQRYFIYINSFSDHTICILVG